MGYDKNKNKSSPEENGALSPKTFHGLLDIYLKQTPPNGRSFLEMKQENAGA